MYSSDFESALAAMLGAFMIVFLIVGAIALLLYILQSVGIMTIAKNRGMANPWLIWIPVVGIYTVGAIADDITEKEGGKGIFRYLLLGGSVLNLLITGGVTASAVSNAIRTFNYYGGGYEEIAAMSGLGSLTSILGLAVLVVHLIALNKIFKCYRPQNATSWTVLCVFFGFLRSIFPFVIRNNQPSWTTQQPPYGGGYPPQQPPYGGGYPPQQPPYGGGYPPQQPPYDGGYPPQQPPYDGGQPPQQPAGQDPAQQEPGTPPVNAEDSRFSQAAPTAQEYFSKEGVSDLFKDEPNRSPLEDDDKPPLL